MNSYSFPEPFTFGTATAAYQIEGAADEDGRGPSIWDVFSHTPGRTDQGDTGDVACDHYHRYQEDIELMSDLGVDAYRLSISWPRVMPTGTGTTNPQGLAFYRSLLEGLRSKGIRPVVTLYHWDLPQALQDSGGWAERSTAVTFARYARAMAEEFGDLVDLWTTLNEPWCSAYLGHGSGIHAPGITDPATSLKVAHHLNLAHGLAVQAIREVLGETARCSVTLNLQVPRPADPDDPADVAAAEKVETIGNDVFLAPMLEGRLPEELRRATASVTDWSFVEPGDLEMIHQRLDVLGINYYSTMTVRPKRTGDSLSSGGHGQTEPSPWPGCDDVIFLDPSGPLTDMGWNIEPQGLTDLLVATSRRFPRLPLIVTENGAAYRDEPDASGRVNDVDRIAYLRDHIAAVGRAREAGAVVEGYFVWSLLDNFEWACGYSKRFGIVRVDYRTLARTPKASFDWYRDLVATRELHLD
jgi:beta-glucosidase